MEPVSITGASIGLLAAITNLSFKATEIVGKIRDAKKDMEALHAGLSALLLCVEALKSCAGNPRIQYPPNVQNTLVQVLKNCESTTKELLALLDKLFSKRIGRRLQWMVVSGDVSKLRSRLAAQKATISIAIDSTNLMLLSSIVSDVAQIRAGLISQVIELKTQLLNEISRLKMQFVNDPVFDEQSSFAMNRFLDETSSVLDGSNSYSSPTAVGFRSSTSSQIAGERPQRAMKRYLDETSTIFDGSDSNAGTVAFGFEPSDSFQRASKRLRSATKCFLDDILTISDGSDLTARAGAGNFRSPILLQVTVERLQIITQSSAPRHTQRPKRSESRRK